MFPEALVGAARGFYEVFEKFSGFLNGTQKTTKVHKMNALVLISTSAAEGTTTLESP